MLDIKAIIFFDVCFVRKIYLLITFCILNYIFPELWELVIGHWSLVIGHWSLVIGQKNLEQLPTTNHQQPPTLA
jgi:hypothetical protein